MRVCYISIVLFSSVLAKSICRFHNTVFVVYMYSDIVKSGIDLLLFVVVFEVLSVAYSIILAIDVNTMCFVYR